jgi:hypothetical protein
MDRGIRQARYMTLALGALALIYGFRIVRLFFPKHPAIAISAMAMVATLPALINTCSIVYNDALGLLTTFASFHGALRLLTLGKTPWRLFVCGAWFALAVFTRISGLFIVAPAMLMVAIAMLIHTPGPVWRKLVSATVVCTAMMAGMAALSGWFYYRNYKLYGDVTASGELLRLFGRKPHGTTKDLMLSSSSWDAMFNALWGRLAGGVSLKWATEKLAHWACLIPLLMLPKAIVHLRDRWRSVVFDRRWFAILACVIALVFVIVPMFMYHAKGGNLNARYAFSIIWFPAMLIAIGGTSMKSPVWAQASTASFFVIAVFIEDIYARALTKRTGAEAMIPAALKANGVSDSWGTWLWLFIALVVGIGFVMHAVGKLHRRIDHGDAPALEET